MGYLGSSGYDWDRLSALFALHKNCYWRKESELILDLGPFVALLEYAAGVEARIVGKPARPFFELALADMVAEPATTIMIGDDIANEIAGAQNAGLRAVQVRTGKFRAADEARADILLDARIDSIRELPGMLDRLV
jgi:ribonucleotide monophosphatase NagD (HAD superfamily)